MRIIIEGANKSGKTTLTNEVLKVLSDYKTFHFTDFEKEQGDFFSLILQENVIFDRSHVSYLLYNFMEHKEINSKLFWRAESLCRVLGVWKIFLDAPGATLKERNGHHEKYLDELGKLYFCYYLYEPRSKVYIDTNEHSISEEVETILKVVNTCETP